MLVVQVVANQVVDAILVMQVEVLKRRSVSPLGRANQLALLRKSGFRRSCPLSFDDSEMSVHVLIPVGC